MDEQRPDRPLPPVLDYGRPASHDTLARLTNRVRPQHLTFVIAAGTFVFCGSARETPLWVAGAASLVLSLLWHLYARERSRRPAGVYSLVTDQLLLATVLSAEGIFATIIRASRISQVGYWLPYNQTFMLNPAWALQPLWHTAAGVAWFTVVLASVAVRRRR